MEQFYLNAVISLAEDGPIIDILVNGHNAKGLIDTGAKYTCISTSFANKIGATVVGTAQYDGSSTYTYSVTLDIAGQQFLDHEVYGLTRLDRTQHPILIGRDILTAFTLEYRGYEGTFSLN